MVYGDDADCSRNGRFPSYSFSLLLLKTNGSYANRKACVSMAIIIAILLAAEMFMGIYFNLSFWYKLIDEKNGELIFHWWDAVSLS